MLYTELENVMENFYLCSHLALCAINKNNHVFLSMGHTIPHPLEQSLSKETLATLQERLSQDSLIHHVLEDGRTFTICAINPKYLELGCFVIGPYTTDIHLKNVLPFKPAHCMVHLIDVLYAIGSSFTQTHEEVEEEYNYHVSKAKDYIEIHYAEPITLDALASYLGLHKSYFCTIFKKATKQSFCSYTNMVRVEKSKDLLKEGTDSILEIALSVGFSSASYFNTTFKKLVGMTPIEYRNQNI